jgi:hypothetical protein
MHPKMRHGVPVTAALAMVLTLQTHGVAQEGEDQRASSIRAVIDYRSTVIDDTTAKFDLCPLAGQGVDVSELRARVAERAPGMVREGCDAPGGWGRQPSVRVDSVVQPQGGDVRVHVTVIRGEWVHREDFSLGSHSPGSLPGVREVRLWGAVQARPRNPAPRP